MFLQANHSRLSNADLVTKWNMCSRYSSAAKKLQHRGLQVAVKCTVNSQTKYSPESCAIPQTHQISPAALFCKQCAFARIRTFTRCRAYTEHEHSTLSCGRQPCKHIEETCACPQDQCVACRWCPDPQHELSPTRYLGNAGGVPLE